MPGYAQTRSKERQAFDAFLRGNLNGKPRLQAIEDIRRVHVIL